MKKNIYTLYTANYRDTGKLYWNESRSQNLELFQVLAHAVLDSLILKINF